MPAALPLDWAPEYWEPEQQSPPAATLRIWEEDCLPMSGMRDYPRPFRSVPGDTVNPGLTWQGDECTGRYQDIKGAEGLSLGKYPRFYWAHRGMGFRGITGPWGWLGPNPVLTAERDWELPDQSGELGLCGYRAKAEADVDAGLVVSVPDPLPGAYASVEPAEPAGDPMVGMAVETVASGAQVLVRTSGLVELADWTAATGTTTLEEPIYYLDTGGTLASTGTDRVGIRVSPTTLKLTL